ncbi:MAG: DoxX family protein [Candidatus Pacebacteria bacterium]|nr:DoxX family protein [Candidatus Paceibacterota bacterium]
MKNLLKCVCGERMQDVAPFALRLATGAIFIAHGYMKWVGGVDATAGFLSMLGFPMPAVFAVLLIVAELGGGILLLFGAFTHWVAKILVFVSAVALLTVHAGNGFFVSQQGFEFILLILTACLSLMITGAGRWSVDWALKHRGA